MKTLRKLMVILSVLALAACSSVKVEPTKDVEEDTHTIHVDYELASAVYPVMIEHPRDEDYIREDGSFDGDAYDEAMDKWYESYSAQRAYADGVDFSYLDAFNKAAVREFISGETNSVMSPLNIYLCLGMLAEVSDGNTRDEILKAMNVSSIEELEEKAKILWNANYLNDGVLTSVLGSSFWLHEGLSYKEETLKRLVDYYYASSFSGAMGSAEYNAALNKWLKEQTGGLLDPHLELSTNTILALATTIYFKASWSDAFDSYATKEDVFHALKEDKKMDFMHSEEYGDYYSGKTFTAVNRTLNESGAMWFILPNENSSVSDVLKGDELYSFLANPSGNRVNIAYTIPKFDVNSTQSLVDGLYNMGIHDAFDGNVSNFTPLTDASEIALSQAEHAARVKIDEDGVEAAAYTVMTMETTAFIMDDTPIEFRCDRPFIFVITNSDGVITFIGSVVE